MKEPFIPALDEGMKEKDAGMKEPFIPAYLTSANIASYCRDYFQKYWVNAINVN